MPLMPYFPEPIEVPGAVGRGKHAEAIRFARILTGTHALTIILTALWAYLPQVNPTVWLPDPTDGLFVFLGGLLALTVWRRIIKSPWLDAAGSTLLLVPTLAGLASMGSVGFLLGWPVWCIPAMAFLAALYSRDARGGGGEHVDVSLLEACIGTMTHHAMHFLISDELPPRRGNMSAGGGVPSGMFACADGSIVISVGNDRQFARFCREVLERPDILADPRYATNRMRVLNREELREVLAGIFVSGTIDAWIAKMVAAGKSDDEIVAHYVEQYGERVLMAPRGPRRSG